MVREKSSCGFAARTNNAFGVILTGPPKAACQQLGIIAQVQRDFTAAEKWYLKSLEIEEKQRNEHGAALTYMNLGCIARDTGRFDEAAGWYIRSIQILTKYNDPYHVEMGIRNFMRLFQQCPPDMRETLKSMWADAGLGEFPPIPDADDITEA